MPALIASAARLCLLGAGTCGSVTWDFPVWEILVPTVVGSLVAGLVTWLTIRVSVREARRAVTTQRASDVRAAINDLGVASVAPADDEAMPARRAHVAWLIRSTGLPYATVAAEWVDASAAARASQYAGRPQRPEFDTLWTLVREGYSTFLVHRLNLWLDDPTAQGKVLALELRVFRRWTRGDRYELGIARPPTAHDAT